MRAAVATRVLAAAVLVAGCSSDDDAAPDTSTTTTIPPVTAGPVAATELLPGDCVTGLVIGANERAQIRSARVVRCDGPHDLEVFATFTLSAADFKTEGDDYPGQQRVVDTADAGCNARLAELGDLGDTIGLISVWPTQMSWSQGDRIVACAAYSTTGAFDGGGLVAG